MTPEEIRKQLLGTAGVEEEDTDSLFAKAGVCFDGKNYVDAFTLAKQAADRGHAAACNLTGLCYAKGLGVQSNPVVAKELFERSAQAGYTRAMRNFALAAMDKSFGPPDHALAIQYLFKADAEGDPIAPGILAQLYLDGKAVTKDPTKAVQLLLRGMERGDDNAHYTYATCLKNGDGVEKNLQKALESATSLRARGFAKSDDLVASIEAELSGKLHVDTNRTSDCTDQRVGTKRTNRAANEANTIIKRLIIALALALTLGPIGLIYVSWKRSIAVAAILWALWWWQPQLWLLWWSGLSIAAVVLFGVGRSRSGEDDLGFRSKTYQRQQRRNG